MNQQLLERILKSMQGKRVLVIGDMMIDHYIYGTVSRISPEAPVPILDMHKEEYRLGGAANVALNIKTLGGEAIPIGVTGSDMVAEKMGMLYRQQGISSSGLIIDSERSTTLKTRLMAGQQQLARIDKEDKKDIPKVVEEQIIRIFKELAMHCDAIIIEDYNKGLLTEGVIDAVLKTARELQKPVTVDPKFHNFFNYKGVTVFKPNFKELKQNLNVTLSTESEFLDAGKKLLNILGAENVMVTRGEYGLTVFKKDNSIHSIPSYTREVFDVSGAGDTVISSLTLALAGGATIEEAAEIANYAAGVVCGKSGTSSVKPEEIIDYFEQYEHKR
jgi:rfaE bifunctional protein kinase chain/domain